MNTRKGKAKFKNVQILLESGCGSTIVMGRLVEKLHTDKYAVMQWHPHVVNITTDLKVKVNLTSPVLSAVYVVTWKCHMNESA